MAWSIILQTDWLIQPRFRHLVATHVWLVEPSKLVAQKDIFLVARTLCQHSQLKKTVPVEFYSPSGEPIHLYSKTTWGILTSIKGVTDVQLETVTGNAKKVNEAKIQRQSNQALPEEVQALVDEAV